MIKCVKSLVYTAALFGSTMFVLNGCGLDLGGGMRTILAILQEDIFG
jgi:hypothetical protein